MRSAALARESASSRRRGSKPSFWAVRRSSPLGVSHAKGYSHVWLDYRHRGTSCKLRRGIRRSTRAQTLAPGDSLAILVDPGRSRRLVLAELFDRGAGADARRKARAA
jgi:hypothetical protein